MVIPCYNAAPCIRRCLDSIYAQTLAPLDVVVVDDGSTDNSLEIVRQYDPKIVTVSQANQGPSAARNRGVGLAGGKFIALLDADDYWAPTFLEKTRRFLDEHPEAVAVSVGQRIKLFGHEEVVAPAILRGQHNLQPTVLENFFDFWSKHNHITTGSVLIRKELLDAAGGQRSDLRVCEDLELWAHLATFGKWGFIPEVLFVSDPEIVAATVGWFNKHRMRWSTCPTVEQWESRIVPRLKESDWPGFRVSRGKVAQNLAHNLVLGGRNKEALETVRKHGSMFPENRYGKWMRVGSGSPFFWAICCGILRLRERVKAVLLATGRMRKKSRSSQKGEAT